TAQNFLLRAGLFGDRGDLGKTNAIPRARAAEWVFRANGGHVGAACRIERTSRFAWLMRAVRIFDDCDAARSGAVGGGLDEGQYPVVAGILRQKAVEKAVGESWRLAHDRDPSVEARLGPGAAHRDDSRLPLGGGAEREAALAFLILDERALAFGN